jgi:hypothetical protein
MDSHQRFALNEPKVIQEVIDGEAIIADLGRGFYYSLDPIGSRVWDALISGCSPGEVSAALAVQFPLERDTIAQGIVDLIERLLREELIVRREQEGATVNRAGELLAGISAAAFVAPVLSKYTDMEQLLLLDPIHEVDETGWPNEAGETGNKQSDKTDPG